MNSSIWLELKVKCTVAAELKIDQTVAASECGCGLDDY